MALRRPLALTVLALAALATAVGPAARAAPPKTVPPSATTTPQALLTAYSAAAGTAASAERGQRLFTTQQANEMGWSCASCHGEQPTRPGRNDATEKEIAPLAPSANPKRFTDRARVDGWFDANCRDVLGRVCTAGERADVLAWLLTL